MKNFNKIKALFYDALKINLKMKLTAFLLFATFLQIQAISYSQNTKISLDLQNVSVEDVLDEIQSLTDFKFFYDTKIIELEKVISVKAKKEKVSTILKNVFANTDIFFTVLDKQIILKRDLTKNKEPAMVKNMVLQQHKDINGTITDNLGEPLPGASVLVKETNNGTTTDLNGNFNLKIADNATTLIISYVGFKTQEVTIGSRDVFNVRMAADVTSMDEVVVTGNRAKPRTILNSPAPIDNIGVKELTSSGKPTIERMLTFKVPSFNSQNQYISDATAHYDPADLRGLGPSRTLVLINGKRKNQSAQVYLNRNPGKGEVGVDLKSIPTAAIERVEVLRDGASAMYGSDAIAGVINMVLKKNATYSTFTASSGITSKGDGFNFASDLNTGLNFGNGGSINLTFGYYNQKLTNRAGKPGIADLPSNPLPNWVEWATENPDLGMHVGQPDMEKGDLFVNVSYPVGKNSEFYTFHGVTLRKGRSFAFYRAPYWRQSDVGNLGFLTPPENFKGYQPTFEAKIKDHINVAGVNFSLSDSWTADASVTYGFNSVFYTIGNSVNRDYLKDHGTSPRTFKPGGYSFNNIIGNLDFTGLLSDQVSVAFGFEYKKENFESFEGDPLSYYKGGSDSFAGIKPAEAGKWDRNNLAAYAQLDFDISDDLLLGVAGRYEDYSDFGSNFSWKVNGRYKLGKNGALRASYSTGFRAPSLHQRYLTNSQYVVVAGSNEPFVQGTLANDNAAVKALGVPGLFAETSVNISAGLTYKFNKNLYASIDLYQINVDDRILFCSQITSDNDNTTINPVEQILEDNNVVALQFFINAGDTKTKGADIVVNYKSDGGFGVSLAGNLNETEIEAISTPDVLAQNGYNIFARQEAGLIINSRPKSKFILGLSQDFNKCEIGLNNTLFGPVTVTAPEYSDGIDQKLSSKLVTDLYLSYKFTDKFTLTGNVNNLFDVYPDPTDPATKTTQAGHRFIYSPEVQQLGELGTNFSVRLKYEF